MRTHNNKIQITKPNLIEVRAAIEIKLTRYMKATKNLCLVMALLFETWAKAGPGSLDTSYVPTINSSVFSVALQQDGRIVIGGNFSLVNSVSRSRLARLYPDGSIDTTFLGTGSGANGTVNCLVVQSDARIVVGGDFSFVNSSSRSRVARLNSNGNLDASFVPTNTLTSTVFCLAVQSDNKVIVGGSFSGWLERLNADGTFDPSFVPTVNAAVNAVAVQTDGRILIGGAFSSVNGVTRNDIARLTSDGGLDPSFQSGLTGTSGSAVRCLLVQSDGKIMVGGDFSSMNGVSRGRIARLNSDGSVDTGFAPTSGASSFVYAVAVQSDNNILIGGIFTSYFYSPTSYFGSRVARLYADASVEPSFFSSVNSTVRTLAVQNDGRIMVGGDFTSINGTNRNYLGRLYGNLYPPEFITQPVSRGTNVGATVTFSALVRNPTPTSYQWRKDGSNIFGATGMSYTLSNVQFGDAGSYSVLANNAVGGVTSSNAILQVGVAPAITQQPTSLTVTQGQSATFTLGATGTSLNYYWKKDGTFIPGETNSSLAFASVVYTNAATYTCLVSNFVGNMTSTGAVLTVIAPPAILIQPTNQTVGVGSSLSVSVTAVGTTPLDYQWWKDDAALIDFTNTSFTIANAQTGHSGNYSVVITNMLGSITSSVATINVILYPPIIRIQRGGTGLELRLNSASNYLYVLQTTTNLTPPLTWQSVATNAADDSGFWMFTDTNWGQYPQRFYRVRSP